MSRAGAVGTIYLLHFDRPLSHARHYLGWTEYPEERLAHHAAGTGARLTAAARQAGITWVVAREWKGTKTRERQLKNQGGRSRLCPICRPMTRRLKDV